MRRRLRVLQGALTLSHDSDITSETRGSPFEIGGSIVRDGHSSVAFTFDHNVDLEDQSHAPADDSTTC